jgi:hypothetical protein
MEIFIMEIFIKPSHGRTSTRAVAEKRRLGKNEADCFTGFYATDRFAGFFLLSLAANDRLRPS